MIFMSLVSCEFMLAWVVYKTTMLRYTVTRSCRIHWYTYLQLMRKKDALHMLHQLAGKTISASTNLSLLFFRAYTCIFSFYGLQDAFMLTDITRFFIRYTWYILQILRLALQQKFPNERLCLALSLKLGDFKWLYVWNHPMGIFGYGRAWGFPMNNCTQSVLRVF